MGKIHEVQRDKKLVGHKTEERRKRRGRKAGKEAGKKNVCEEEEKRGKRARPEGL